MQVVPACDCFLFGFAGLRYTAVAVHSKFGFIIVYDHFGVTAYDAWYRIMIGFNQDVMPDYIGDCYAGFGV